MCGHVMRGRFMPRCADCDNIDYSTAWSPLVRIPILIIITIIFMRMHPAIDSFIKRAIWMIVKPLALLIGYFFVVIVHILIFTFVDGPSMIANRNNTRDLDVLGSLDTKNNTKLNAIMSRLHATEAEPWIPGGVFDKKYKPFLVADNMNFSGPRQKVAMTRKRNISC
ncbi:uncharacterized protein CTRU02_209678 [Colletotrichum truncatum]|uniref:Uncharacterized protein n=1 Tax=Colletotrichum truncatum TaxID=5467 RepID=A0ACC3YVC6_COLTU|nr:uncharacterized protein CTRU02_12021 [Colletotrichum truncatum]KAF6785089.1 hypothetical protein CTRU02_12021 [Colletotrichum truncatum]